MRNTLSQIITLLRELFDEVSRHEVVVDVLTRLLNRRFLPTIFKREILHATRAGKMLSTLLIDVDKFKHINDIWGHNTGDDEKFPARSTTTCEPVITFFATAGMSF